MSPFTKPSKTDEAVIEAAPDEEYGEEYVAEEQPAYEPPVEEAPAFEAEAEAEVQFDADPGYDTGATEYAAVEADVYVTESGRTIRVGTGAAAIPTAKKRKRAIIRASALIIFGIIVAFMGGVIYLALNILSDPGTGGGGGPKNIGFDVNVNPLTTKPATFFHIELRDKVAVVVDATSLSNTWIEDMKAAILKSVDNDDLKHRYQFVLYTDLDALAFPKEKAMPIKGRSRKQLEAMLKSATGLGWANPTMR